MSVKKQLHAICLAQVQQKIAEIEAAIAERRDVIANETKSSMGDKYETTREMLQQEINMNLERLKKATTDLDTLTRIDIGKKTEVVNLGSVVVTNNGSFYCCISAGKLQLDDKLYYAVSISSPIGGMLKGKKQGDSFYFNDKEYVIKELL